MSTETCADLREDFNAFKLNAAVTPPDRQFNVTLKMKTPVADCGGEQVSFMLCANWQNLKCRK